MPAQSRLSYKEELALKAENAQLRADIATAYESRDEAVERANRLEFGDWSVSKAAYDAACGVRDDWQAEANRLHAALSTLTAGAAAECGRLRAERDGLSARLARVREVADKLRGFVEIVPACGEVVKGLKEILSSREERIMNVNTLRAAIALLQPPTTAEIEAVRAWAAGFTMVSEGDVPVRETLLGALDALAREPGLLRALEDVPLSITDGAMQIRTQNARIAALEARLARVREWANHARRRNHDEMTIACLEDWMADDDAALAADAGPAGQEPK